MKVIVDGGALKMVINMLYRAAERHDEPTLYEAAVALVESSRNFDDETKDIREKAWMYDELSK